MRIYFSFTPQSKYVYHLNVTGSSVYILPLRQTKDQAVFYEITLLNVSKIHQIYLPWTQETKSLGPLQLAADGGPEGSVHDTAGLDGRRNGQSCRDPHSGTL